MLRVYDFHVDPKTLNGYKTFMQGGEQAIELVERKLKAEVAKHGSKFSWSADDSAYGIDYQIRVKVQDEMLHVGTITFNRVPESAITTEIALFQIKNYGNWYDGKFIPSWTDTEAHNILMFDVSRMKELEAEVNEFLKYLTEDIEDDA